MLETPSEKLLEIEQIGLRGEYYKAIEETDKILQNESSSEIDKIQAMILKGRFLYRLGIFETLLENYDLGLELVNKALMLSEKQDRIFQIFDSLDCKYSLLWNLSKYEESIEETQRMKVIFERIKKELPDIAKKKEPYYEFSQTFDERYKALYKEGHVWDYEKSIKHSEKIIDLAKDVNDRLVLKDAYLQLYEYHYYRDDYDLALEIIEKALETAVELDNDYFISQILAQIGWTYMNTGEYETLLEYAKKALEIREKLGNERVLASSYGQIGAYYGLTGDWKTCLEHSLKAHNIFTDNGKRKEEIGWLNNIAVSHCQLGDYDKALELYQEDYEYRKERGDRGKYTSLSNIALVYIAKGEFDKALKINEEILDVFSRLGNKFGIASCYLRSASISKKKGLYKKSLEFLEKALEIQIKIKNKAVIAGTYYELILVAVKINEHELAKDYFEKLEKITEELEHKSIKRIVMVAEGIILKNSSETRDRIRAEVLFEQLLQEEVESYMLIEILLQFSELLLVELKETSDKKYLKKLEKSISDLIEIGTKNHLPAVIIECLWFKSQLALLEFDLDKARELLTQALNTAESKGYNSLALKITSSKELLIKQTIALEEIGTAPESIAKRMEVIKLENGFKKLKEKDDFQFKIERVESSKSLLSIKI